jgi:AAA family ATP:ADP antiporter
VNTTGEFILGKTVIEEAQRLSVSASGASSADGKVEPVQLEQRNTTRDFIARFYGEFFFTVNLIGVLAQLFLVSRVIKFCGVPASLYFLPAIALTGYTLIALVPGLAFIRWVKVVENSTDYSLQNTVRQALFLPTTREEKYKAKAAIDTFFVRIGDLLSTGLVVLSAQFALSMQTLSVVNVCFTALWLLLVVGIGSSYRGLAAARAKERA